MARERKDEEMNDGKKGGDEERSLIIKFVVCFVSVNLYKVLGDAR